MESIINIVIYVFLIIMEIVMEQIKLTSVDTDVINSLILNEFR